MYTTKISQAELAQLKDAKTKWIDLSRLLSGYHGDEVVASLVAIHPNCKESVLGNFVRYDFSPAFENPKFEQFKAKPTWAARYLIDQQEDSYAKRLKGYYSSYNNHSHYVHAVGLDKDRPQIFKILGCIKHDVVSEIERAARLKNTPEYLVEIFLSHKSARVRAALATRPDLSENTYLELAKDKLKSIRTALVKNSTIPSSVVRILVDDKLDAIGEMALQHPHCPRQVKKNQRVQKKKKKNLKANEIVELSYDEKISLLLDKSTSSQVLQKFLGDPLPVIRYLLGLHKNCSEEIVRKTLEDPIDWVQESVAYNQNLDTALLSEIIGLNQNHLNHALAQNQSLDESQQLKLFENLKTSSHLHLANSTSSRKILEEIAKLAPAKVKRNWRVKLKDALKEKSKGKTLKQMLRLRDYRYRWLSRMLIMRDDCPEDIIELLNHYSPDELQYNPKLAIQLLESPGSIGTQAYQEWKIKQWLSERVAPSFVAHHYLHLDGLKERRQAAGNPYVCIAEFQTLVFERDTIVKKRLTERRDLPRFMWYALGLDKNENVRKAVTKSKLCPAEVIKSLAEASNTSVSMAARNAARKRNITGTASTEELSVTKLRKKERQEVARTTATKEKQVALAKDKLYDVKTQLLINKSVHADVLMMLLKDEDERVRAVFASGPYAENNYSILSKDASALVRQSLVNNRRIEAEAKYHFMSDESPLVRLSLAKLIVNRYSKFTQQNDTKFVDEYTLKLVEDEDPEIRLFMVKRYGLAESIQKKLVADKHLPIRQYLAKESKFKEVVKIMLDDEDINVRNLATQNNIWRNYQGQFNCYDPVFLEAIKHSEDDLKRYRYAQYGDDLSILRSYIEIDDEKLHACLIRNKKLPEEFEREFMAKPNGNQLIQLIGRYTPNKSTFVKLLDDIGAEQDVKRTLFGYGNNILGNDKFWADKDIQNKYYRHANSNIRDHIASQSNLPKKIALKLLSSSGNAVRRKIVDKTPHLEVLEAAIDDPDYRVLRHIIEKPFCTEELQWKVLNGLKDPNREELKDTSSVGQLLDWLSISMDSEQEKLAEKLTAKTTVPEIYLDLIEHQFDTVAYEISSNQAMLKLPKVQEYFVNHEKTDLRCIIARQENLSKEFKAKLKKDQTKIVRDSVLS